MIVDISEALVEAARLPEWDLAAAYKVANRFFTAGRWISHDQGAGEDWVFVVDAHQLLASVHRHRRIAFVLPPEADKLDQGECVVVTIPDFKALIVTAPHDLIAETFVPLDPLGDPFCALDLFIGTM